MPKSSKKTHAERLNWTIQQLPLQGARTLVPSLIKRYGVSRRQAYRYVSEAQVCQSPVPVPQSKRVFTVKLPDDLISAIRRHARARETSLSDLVAEALRIFLDHGDRGGKKAR